MSTLLSPSSHKPCRDTEREHRLLIIEDSAEIAEILREIGKSAGYEVFVLADKQLAAEVCAEFSPSVLLINPGHVTSVFAPPRRARSLGFLRGLASHQAGMQIILISGNPSAVRQSILEEGLSLGLNMVGHVGKPFDIDALEKQLAELRH